VSSHEQEDLNIFMSWKCYFCCSSFIRSSGSNLRL